MCGRTCRNGGRYIPGPPEVCARHAALSIAARRAAVAAPPAVVPIPGTGVGVGVGLGGVGVGVRPSQGRNCRTVTTRRPDGSMTKVTQCN